MRIVFMGTPDFAAASLQKLLDEKFNVVGVFTQPDKPKGRGMEMAFSPVKELALAHGLPVFQPEKMRDGTALGILKELKPDREERSCAACCAQLLMELLAEPAEGGRRSRRRKLKSFELLQKKSQKNSYTGFAELYQDIKLTALPSAKVPLRGRLGHAWQSKRDGLFRVLLVLCILLAAAAVVMLVSQLIFGDVPLLRLFHHTFDVIGTENLHQGGRL